IGYARRSSNFWDSWWQRNAPFLASTHAQSERLANLVAFARARSPFYRRTYAALPARVSDVEALPVVTKRELMASFDDWVTDPAVRKADVEAFLADRT